MVGTKIVSTPKRTIVVYTLPLASIFLLLIALLIRQWPPVVLAIGPIILFYKLRKQLGSFECELRENGIWLPSKNEEILYSSITAIEYVPTEKKPDSPIILSRPKYSLLIPAILNVDSTDLFDFLISKTNFNLQRQVPDSLQGYYQEEVDDHGESAVFVLNARQTAGKRPRKEAIAIFVRGLMLTSVVYGFGMILDAMMMFAMIICWVFAGLAWAYSAESRKRLLIEPGILNSVIILTPDGMAMQQGSVSGTVEWSRVLDVSLIHHALSIEHTRTMMGIAAVTVGTSKIYVRDVYELPILSVCRLLNQVRTEHMGTFVTAELVDPGEDSPFRAPTQR